MIETKYIENKDKKEELNNENLRFFQISPIF